MYPQTQAAMNSSAYYGEQLNAGAALQPPSAGIASRVQDLQKQVQEAVTLAYQTKSALGISPPESNAKEPNQPSSLADVITDLRIKLSRACSDLQDVIQHLNS